MDLDKKIIACAHHKCGANYTLKTFREIARSLNLDLWLKFYNPEPDADSWDICVHQHGRVSELMQTERFKGWHCVRHPMSAVYSAALYHEKCKEPWVDVPLRHFTSNTFWSASHGPLYDLIKDPSISISRKSDIMNADYAEDHPGNLAFYDSGYDLGGKSYREFLKSMTSMEDKILFEMRAYSQGVVNDMLRFPSDDRFFTIKLEEISHDRTMRSIYDALLHLGFEGNDLLKSLEIASSFCIWKTGLEPIKNHATTGMSTVWQSAFTQPIVKEFRRLFGHAEEALGYQNPSMHP